MIDSFFKYVYTLQEVGIALNLSIEEIATIKHYTKYKKLDNIFANIPILQKFKPFVFYMNIEGEKVYVISARIFDKYLLTGLLPDVNTEYREPDLLKKEYWQYDSSYIYELNTKENWDFALKYFREKDPRIEAEEIWNVFLSGCARMNYYQGNNTNIDQRIKYAIMEYMVRRPQFFTTDDFIDNPLLHEKYGSNNIQNKGGEYYEQ